MLEEALTSLPATISATYELLLSSINDRFKKTASRAFQWLALCMEPLTIEELVDIIAIDINAEPKFRPDWRMPDPEEILRVCSSLITITSAEDDQKRYVKLAHSSIKDYLLSDTIRVGRASEYAVDCSHSHSDIATACLYYLSSTINNGETPLIKGMGKQILHDTYPLAAYAARYWANHAELASAVAESFWPPMIELFEPEPFRIWFDIWTQPDLVDYVIDGDPYTLAEADIDCLRLAFATWHGLSRLLQHLLKLGAAPDARDFEYNTALQMAASNNDLKSAEILLHYGADPNAPALGHGYPALSWAAKGGCDDVVKILLDYGADINVIPRTKGDGITRFSSPLTDACKAGNVSTIQLLLSKGADANVGRGTSRSTPLTIASALGDIHVVRLLIAHGATPVGHLPTFNPLHHAVAAVSRRKVDVVKALIASGANVNTYNGQDRTALDRACAVGSKPLAEVLIASGAHLDAVSSLSQTPLSTAISFGHASLVQLLVEKGAKVTMENRDLIEEVAQDSSPEIPKISILEHLFQGKQSQIDKLRSCGKALHAAFENGDEDLIRFLIDYSSKVNQYNESNIDSLQNAGITIQSKILKLWIDAGPNFDIPDDALTDALETALHGGHASLARKLLAKGASQDVDPRYAVQLEEVLNGKNMLTDVEPENIKSE